MEMPLNERQAILNDILSTDDDRVRLGKVFKASGVDFLMPHKGWGWKASSLKMDSTYAPDRRSKEWLKIKVHKRQEVVIVGFTKMPIPPNLSAPFYWAYMKKENCSM